MSDRYEQAQRFYSQALCMWLNADATPLVAHTEALFAAIEYAGLNDAEATRLRDETFHNADDTYVDIRPDRWVSHTKHVYVVSNDVKMEETYVGYIFQTQGKFRHQEQTVHDPVMYDTPEAAAQALIVTGVS